MKLYYESYKTKSENNQDSYLILNIGYDTFSVP